MLKIFFGLCILILGVSATLTKYSVPELRGDLQRTLNSIHQGSRQPVRHDNNRKSDSGTLVKCEKNVEFIVKFDGERKEMRCNYPIDGQAPESPAFRQRCTSCCGAWGFTKNYSKDQVVGFVSGNNCICCNGKKDNRRNY